jgi:hypothetical protein
MIVKLQIAWALGCVAWNAYGLFLISQGMTPIGPTASAVGAVLCVVFALLFWWWNKTHQTWPYILVTLIAVIMAAYTVYGALTKDPALWPSPFWRWAGILLNGLGVVAGIAGIKEALKWSNRNQGAR